MKSAKIDIPTASKNLSNSFDSPNGNKKKVVSLPRHPDFIKAKKKFYHPNFNFVAAEIANSPYLMTFDIEGVQKNRELMQRFQLIHDDHYKPPATMNKKESISPTKSPNRTKISQEVEVKVATSGEGDQTVGSSDVEQTKLSTVIIKGTESPDGVKPSADARPSSPNTKLKKKKIKKPKEFGPAISPFVKQFKRTFHKVMSYEHIYMKNLLKFKEDPLRMTRKSYRIYALEEQAKNEASMRSPNRNNTDSEEVNEDPPYETDSCDDNERLGQIFEGIMMSNKTMPLEDLLIADQLNNLAKSLNTQSSLDFFSVQFPVPEHSGEETTEAERIKRNAVATKGCPGYLRPKSATPANRSSRDLKPVNSDTIDMNEKDDPDKRPMWKPVLNPPVDYLKVDNDLCRETAIQRIRPRSAPSSKAPNTNYLSKYDHSHLLGTILKHYDKTA